MMVFTKQPIVAVVGLYVAIIASAMLWISMSQEFLACILLIMHAGAVMTMFLYVTMTVSVASEHHYSLLRGYAGIALVGLLWIALFFGVVPMGLDRTMDHVAQSMGGLWISEYHESLWLLGMMLTIGMIACVRLVRPNPNATLKRQQPQEQMDASYDERLTWYDKPDADGHEGGV
jgi:NADH:ubiquinone oxidoreductase subunit 6 (subunit J)